MRPAIEWGKHNAIVLLGAGTERIATINSIEPGTFSYPRIVESVALYNSCIKTKADCKVIVSGGDAKQTGLPEAVVYQQTLLRLGIDVADVFIENDSMNTWQNAQFTGTLLRRYNADRVLLVSSGIHLRRSIMYFAHFGVIATAVRAEYLGAILSPLPLSYNFAVTDFALHEYVGIIRYRVYKILGWDLVRQLPGEA
ncbi:YdcF family protein [Serratia marcescens]|uniref:YdcF family protein n=1 Tax=Serratia marcescens TaxID=615 RepID=UPI0018E235ED|nr:YdcF family protein [Serratia marcescens]